MALFEIRGLVKRFGTNLVLDGIDLDIFEGEHVTLIGESGCGKSVLLKHLIGLIRPDSGSILFDGLELVGLPDRRWIEVRTRVGMLFQEGALFDSLSVEDNVAYGLREHRMMDEKAIEARVAEALTQVDLPGIQRMWPSSLSGGMRKRVALARAFAMHPQVVLYDEPTEGLDPINVTRVNRLLKRLRTEQGVTTVVVTHNMQSAFGVSDRLVFIDRGKVVAEGTPEELKQLDEPRLAPFKRASELRAKTRVSFPDGVPQP